MFFLYSHAPSGVLSEVGLEIMCVEKKWDAKSHAGRGRYFSWKERGKGGRKGGRDSGRQGGNEGGKERGRTDLKMLQKEERCS